MFEKGGEVFSIPKGEGKEEKTDELEFLPYDNEKGYQSKEQPDNPNKFEIEKGKLLVLERLRAQSLGKKVKELV